MLEATWDSNNTTKCEETTIFFLNIRSGSSAYSNHCDLNVLLDFKLEPFDDRKAASDQSTRILISELLVRFLRHTTASKTELCP